MTRHWLIPPQVPCTPGSTIDQRRSSIVIIDDVERPLQNRRYGSWTLNIFHVSVQFLVDHSVILWILSARSFSGDRWLRFTWSHRWAWHRQMASPKMNGIFLKVKLCGTLFLKNSTRYYKYPIVILVSDLILSLFGVSRCFLVVLLKVVSCCFWACFS